MIQICAYCKKKYGEKEPLNDKSETHGICKPCFAKEIKKLETIKKEREHNENKNINNNE